MCLDETPYVVLLRLSHGFDGSSIFCFHCAPEGLKTDIPEAQPRVCCPFEERQFKIKGDSPCSRGFTYATVIVHGRAARISDPTAKLAALQVIADSYARDGARVPGKTPRC